MDAARKFTAGSLHRVQRQATASYYRITHGGLENANHQSSNHLRETSNRRPQTRVAGDAVDRIYQPSWRILTRTLTARCERRWRIQYHTGGVDVVKRSEHGLDRTP